MNTEITGNPANERLGFVYYDADCAWCRALAHRWQTRLERSGFRPIPLQTPGTAQRLGVTDEQLSARMHLQTADGRLFCGADAFVEIARNRRWSRPLAWVAGAPLVLSLLRRGYDWIASRRRCQNGVACDVRRSTPRTPRLPGALPILILLGAAPIAVTLRRGDLPPWMFMWLLAVTLFAGAKWLTLLNAIRDGVALRRRDAIVYLLGWVGMEPREFARLRRSSESAAVDAARWRAAGTRVVLGVALIWLGARWLIAVSPLAAGWSGMIGTILLLHFGLFDLLALAWRRAGYAVKPLMNRPTHAVSVGDFWSARWNRGFHALVHRLVYQPLGGRRAGAPGVMAVFLVSGFIHDLVISVPARGGYGLPTGYFILQGLALLFERSPAGRRLGLARGIPGHLFAVVVVAGPAFWLFPPVFVHNVILPMLHAIGAIPVSLL